MQCYMLYLNKTGKNRTHLFFFLVICKLVDHNRKIVDQIEKPQWLSVLLSRGEKSSIARCDTSDANRKNCKS